MAGRLPTYQNADDRPVSVSLRVPRQLYEQVQQRVQQRRMTLTEALLDGLQLWLDTPADPRELLLSDESNTVMQELREELKGALLDELRKDVQAILASAVHDGVSLAPHREPQPAPASSNSNTVIQEETTKQCRFGHGPYPATRAECPACVRERAQRYRDRKAHAPAP
jgi:hypothetical protein